MKREREISLFFISKHIDKQIKIKDNTNMKKIIVIVCFLILISRDIYGDNNIIYIYENYQLKYRIEDNKIYDRLFNHLYTIDNDKIYTRLFELKYRIDGNKILDTNYQILFIIDKDKIYDRLYNIKYRIERK